MSLGEGGISILIQRVLAALLLLAGAGLVATTEKSLAMHLTAAARHGGQALDLGTDGRVEPEQYGHM
ncbi:MAG TPA: hypothetical protein VIM98_17845, partial [Dyella sp.]